LKLGSAELIPGWFSRMSLVYLPFLALFLLLIAAEWKFGSKINSACQIGA